MSSHEHPLTPGASFVDPKVLARIGNLELLARTIVDGFINGIHKASYLGVSVDFAEHRGYMPGDDIRRIDWQLYARTDRYYVKEFEADSNANFSAILDVSKSMAFSSGGLTKLDYAKYLAASLAYFANRQRDRVGLVTFDSQILERVPSSAKHLDVVLHTIDRAVAGRPGQLRDPLFRMTEFFKRRGILAIISDFYEEPDVIIDAVKRFRAQGHDVMVFHILDPAELEFPYDSASSFEDLETGVRMPIVPDNLRDQYKQLIEEHTSTLAKRFTEYQVDYAVFNTSTPLDYGLFKFLSARERMIRLR
ncbi:MAG: DUF58 domain-containing protein [Vicinamibacterales bacterium]|nr:DUF58 domain-containing protein [Acidobacteriota bacterium]MDP7295243.1 DUF58 domain-containing protein [Vicinamibacterales bacterium]MDP7472614.1 DUF58 domain-containing protein [Vicinamibacterales bacterium]MDP7670761.1 DUF58 domain-containing protein [Vicinamibacterales bacterium]HJO37768.1 DUF58 domain-containing protein [Vicinamibacterales bacterium]